VQLVGIETFLAIVDAGSLIGAADQLSVSQSTVTARLQNLESHLGQTLLRRQKSGVELTAAGFKFQRYAEVMSNLWRQAQQETSLPEGVESVCNIGCHLDLWSGLGEECFGRIRQEQPAVALAAWPGEQAELDRWLGTGLVDIAFTYTAAAHDNQTIHPLPPDQLVLVSNRPDAPMRFDPAYVFVEGGADFRERHAATYADAGTAQISFASAVWARDHLLSAGGSAYLPMRMVADDLGSGALFQVADAPEFSRNVYVVTTDVSMAGRPWWLPLLDQLRQG